MSSSRRYCLITPCRDEEQFARRTIEAVLRQTIQPARWIIVDDGSTDQTPAILAEYAAKVPWISVIKRPDRGERKLGSGVIDAFYDGYDTINPDEFDYICKFDLDLDLPTRYFETLMEKMEANPRLGTCSGKPYFHPERNHPRTGVRGCEDRAVVATNASSWTIPSEASGFISEKCGDENSVGMIKFYRTRCFKQIGGFVRMLMWDGIDCHRCRMLGWVAVSWDEPGLRFEHLRPMGTSHKNWWTGRVRHGVGQWYMGTSLSYMLASVGYRMTRPPLIVGGMAMLWGYVRSALTRQPRYDDLEFRKFMRSYQRACLLKGKRRATEQLNQCQTDVWKASNHDVTAQAVPPAGQSATHSANGSPSN